MNAPDLSEQARAYLAAVRADGRSSNRSHLRVEVGLPAQDFDRAEQELLSAGLIELAGRGGRLQRTPAGRDLPEPVGGIPAHVSDDARKLLAQLPADGSTIGGVRLRSLVDLDNDAYAAALRELRRVRVVRVGPGRGGSVGLAEASGEGRAPGRDVVRAEAELYEPFVEWLRSTWAADEEVTFAHARVTATPAGRQRDTGRWSRPDVTAVQVTSFELLPGKEVEVSTYEIKRADDAFRVEGIFEAAAHGRWAHRVNLVIEEPPGPLPDRYLDEVRRFGLGLYTMARQGDGHFDVAQAVEPRRQSPEPSELNELLGYFFQNETRLRNAYRLAIGR